MVQFVQITTKILERIDANMISYCNFIPEAVWIRETENGIRHITLRRNFTEELKAFGEIEEKHYRYEETDVYIPDRENLQEFTVENFGNLFDLGLQQTEEEVERNYKLNRTKQMINEGSIVDDLQSLGQQITNIMLGV